MGCTNSSEKGGPGAKATKKDMAAMEGNGQNTTPKDTAAKPDQAPAAISGGVGGLNALNAEKMDMSQLVEKEDFHSVYELGDTLGKGNFSVVKKGTHKETGQVYAIKCIKESSLTQEDRDALKIETAILKQMDSPHIIKLYAFYQQPKEAMYYIITEYVSGGELFDRIIAKEFYKESDAQKLVRTIASAIKYCHDRGVVHRDLKPENILLTSKDDDDSIKIADFGFAKQYDTSSDDALQTSCGTPGYVAPEILNGKKYGKEVDMWSFGVIIYILLCGYPPFHHENQKELFKQIRSADFEFDKEYWGGVSTEAMQLIKQLLVKDGLQRLTIEQLIEHPWLKDVHDNDLSQVQKAIAARRKFKAGVQAVIMNQRLLKLTGGGSNPGVGSDAAATDAKEAPEAPAAVEKS